MQWLDHKLKWLSGFWRLNSNPELWDFEMKNEIILQQTKYILVVLTLFCFLLMRPAMLFRPRGSDWKKDRMQSWR